jgi:hypothetical protein
VGVHDDDQYQGKINCGAVVYWHPKEELFEAIKNIV